MVLTSLMVIDRSPSGLVFICQPGKSDYHKDMPVGEQRLSEFGICGGGREDFGG